MALFENFPYTNLHELNLDWLIQEMENLKELVQDGPVISVNGQTGVVTLYQEAQVRLPDVSDPEQTYWNIFRSLNGHLYGIRFDSNGNVYAIRDGIRTKLLTWADIPPEAGVISVNGLYGVVHISGTDIPWMGGENETVFDKLSENEDAIDNLNIVLGTLTNAIKAGIAYLEPNVDDTAIHNIPAGRYVFWKNYAYKSTQAISIGDTLSSTNLQAVGEGGFINALQTEINTLNSKIANVDLTTVISNLSDIPLNTKGRITFAGGVGPIGTSNTLFNYICYGSDNKRTLEVSHADQDLKWITTYNGSSWAGWKEFSLNNKLFNIAAYDIQIRIENSSDILILLGTTGTIITAHCNGSGTVTEYGIANVPGSIVISKDTNILRIQYSQIMTGFIIGNSNAFSVISMT